MLFVDPDRPMPTQVRRSLVGRLGFAAVVLVALTLGAVPGGADLSDELEQLRERQAEVQQEKKDKAAEVDIATAEAGELAAALEVASSEVNEQATKVAAAEQALIAAQDRHDTAVLAVIEHQASIEDLESRVSDQAILSFVNQDEPRSPLLEEVDPNRAVRMQSLVNHVSADGVSVAEELRDAKEDLEIEQKVAADASAEAERIQAAMAEDLAELERRRARQEELLIAAEDRLERSLAEAAALADLDKDLSAEITQKSEVLARQAQRRNNPAPAANSTGFPSAEEIVQVRGFWVHRDIASNFDAMLGHAESEGVVFGGGAYRDHQSQIRLRKAHCGTSNYAVYQMPASRCRPPTARPGASMHEQGKAIDFTYGGRIIGSRNNTGYQWLAANAASYGFYNLPSEPWHWSVNGR